MAIRFEALGSQDRSRFTSGQPDLDDWFRTRAGQDQRRGVARVVVAVDDELGIVGFHSLSSFSLNLSDLPVEIRNRLPRYESVPAVLIGRLARDIRARGRGIGEHLLADVVLRVAAASESVAAYLIVVDAKDEEAAAFYALFGFRGLSSRPNRMFLSVETARRALLEN